MEHLKVVKPLSKQFSSIMGLQAYTPGTEWRMFRFVLSVQVNGGKLLFNGLTRSVVLIPDDWRSDGEVVKQLARMWFLVPGDFDDRKFVKDFRAVLYAFDMSSGDVNNYTILTTTDCNARCWYCFEQGIKKVSMDRATAQRTAEFIKEHHGKRHVFLSWYGGEPLYNLPVIDFICKRLAEWGIGYTSSILTNAYLLNHFVADKAKSLWHLNYIQVTIDGARDSYNRTKNYIYRNKDAFGKVVDNIRYAASLGISVVVRINYLPKEKESIKGFVSELRSLFGENKNHLIKVYVHSLFNSQCFDYHPDALSVDARKNEKSEINRLMEIVRSQGFSPVSSSYTTLTDGIPSHKCMADSTIGVTVSPEGRLYRCCHRLDYSVFGDIWNGKTDDVAFHKTEELCDELPICSDCVYYPECIRLKCCEDDNHCDEERKGRILKNFRLDMLDLYKKWLEKNEEVVESEKV